MPSALRAPIALCGREQRQLVLGAGRRAGPAICHSNARQYLDARAGPPVAVALVGAMITRRLGAR